MNGADEVNMGTDGVVLKMKENPKSQLKETEDEHVSNIHSAWMNHKDLDNGGNDRLCIGGVELSGLAGHCDDAGGAEPPLNRLGYLAKTVFEPSVQNWIANF